MRLCAMGHAPGVQLGIKYIFEEYMCRYWGLAWDMEVVGIAWSVTVRSGVARAVYSLLFPV